MSESVYELSPGFQEKPMHQRTCLHNVAAELPVLKIFVRIIYVLHCTFPMSKIKALVRSLHSKLVGLRNPGCQFKFKASQQPRQIRQIVHLSSHVACRITAQKNDQFDPTGKSAGYKVQTNLRLKLRLCYMVS